MGTFFIGFGVGTVVTVVTEIVVLFNLKFDKN